MTVTIVAQVVDRLGTAAWWWTGTYGGRHLDRCEQHPAANFTDIQPGDIPIELRHDGKILGRIDYLEHGLDHNTDLRAVGTLDIDDDLADMVEGLYCSAEVTGRKRLGSSTAEDCKLEALALVDATAGVGARPVRAFPGDYRESARTSWRHRPTIVDRAAKAAGWELRYRRPHEIRIVRPTGFEERCAANLEPLPVAHRSVGGPFVRPRTGRYIPLPDGSYGEIEYSAPVGHVLAVR